MVSQVTQNLFASNYKDDYADSDNYHRILFNSGRALQARELTQMQTIIQNEIARFGRNIFKEGAAVNPGGATINSQYEFIKLNTSSNQLPTTSIVGNIFTGDSSNLRFKVLEVVPAVGSDPATLYVQYLGDASSGGTTALRATAGEDVSDGVNTLTIQTTNTTLNPAVGQGVKVSSGAGSFFALGHFVFVEQQSLIVSKYSSQYTGTVGFVATESVVTAADDPALYDNQGDVPNTTAPGADRYRIRLNLIDKANVAADETFMYFVDIVNSEVVDVAQATSDYNEINNLLALRTSEESGNYVVRPFKLKFDADSDSSFLRADITPGTAYINGYRANINVPTKLRIAKPTTTTTINNEVVAADYGNFVVASSLVGVPNVNIFERWNLRSATGYGGSTIGTARIRHVVEDGAIYRLHLFDIQMIGNNNFRATRSIGADSANYANIQLNASNEAILVQANNNDLLFPLPNSRPSSVTDISLQVQKRFTATTDGSGNATLGSGLLGAGQTWSNLTDWVVVIDSTGVNVSSTVSISGAGTTTATITGTGANSALIEVLAYVNISAGTSAAKTLTETTVTGTIDSDGTGLKFFSLGKADIFDVSRIRATDSDGIDLTSTFRLDNGQRDNFYNVGRLIVRGGRSVPAGNVFARFRYFTHGAGDFFSVNSYSIPYANIPSHTLADGTVVPLRDVLDFRSRINDAGTGFSGTGSKVIALPQPTDLIQADVTYFMPRFDKLIINDQGFISILQGTADLDPKYPEAPDNSMTLYSIRMNANTLNPEDVSTKFVENKRFTMSDIAQLEKRIDRLEETTALSLLEIATDTLAVLDSSGLLRTKAGFLADNFADHFYSDLSAEDYRASIDPGLKHLRPTINASSIRLIYDSDLSTNTILKGDNVYLKYDEVDFIQQDVVSGTENINPFSVITGTGIITLSPSSDEWREVQYIAARAVDGGTRLSTNEGQLFNNWNWNWNGLRFDETRSVGQTQTSSTAETTGRTTTTTTTVARIVSDETLREVIGDRVVDVALIPFMRSRKVYFQVSALKPYQQYFAFFDGVDVSSWVRSEPFVQFANDPTDFGNQFNNATAHPEGSTTLISDVNGRIEGSFFIPSTSALRFRTGTREFRLINVSNNSVADSTSLAFTTYTAAGVLETRQQTIRSTRQININVARTARSVTESNDNDPVDTSGLGERGVDWDPLAQSFRVNTIEGVFLTKARIYFASKPATDEQPVVLQIRPMVNGYPSAEFIVPGSQVILNPSQVNVVSTQTQAGVLSTPTDFVFAEPVYLSGATEYAIVLLADTTDYNVYIAETEQFILGTTERRVTTQPSMGSLFKSQNGGTWEPAQTQDLTFRLYKADFSTAGGTVVLENANVPLRLLDADPFSFDSGSSSVTVFHPNHGFDSGDTVIISGLDSASTYGGILGTSLLGNRTVSRPDQTGYIIFADSAASSGISAGGNNVLATQNLMFDIAVPFVQALVPENTGLGLQGKFITGRSLAGSETRFVKDVAFRALNNRANNVFNQPKMIANAATETVQLGAGVRSTTIQLPMGTFSPNVSPVVDLQRASLQLFNNIIDKQDSADYSLAGFNVPISYVSEEAPAGGSHVAKHITVPVTLAEDAVGLTILVAANRPAASDFLVYYRTAGEGQVLPDQRWVLLPESTNNPSDQDPNVFREYRYLAGGLGGSLQPFTEYQVKIVFRSTNSSRVPVLKDLRVIALAD